MFACKLRLLVISLAVLLAVQAQDSTTAGTGTETTTQIIATTTGVAGSGTAVPATTTGGSSAATTSTVISETSSVAANSATTEAASSSATDPLTSDSSADAASTTGTAVTVGEITSTSEDVTTTQEPTTTTQPTTTATPAGPQAICGHDPENVTEQCRSGNHTVIELSTTSSSDKYAVPHGEWIRFQGSDNSCLQIPMFDSNKDSCYQPGSCGSQFPYYLHGTSLPTTNTADLTLCTTDRGSTGLAYCCQEKIEVEVIACGDSDSYYLYKLGKSLSAPGKVCLSTEAKTPWSSLLITDGTNLPRKYATLKPSQKEEVVTIIVIIDDLAIFQGVWEDYTDDLMNAIIDAVKGQLGSRRKRATTEPAIVVDVLAGYPEVNDEETEVTYVILVHDENDEPIDKDIVEAAVKDIVDTDVMNSTATGARVEGTTDELPKKLEPSKQTRKEQQSTKLPTAAKGSNLWIAIIIIIGVTAFIVAVAFIAVWCYNFSRKRRSGIGHITYAKDYTERCLADEEEEMGGHVNVAMEEDETALDSNQNANGKTASTASTALQDKNSIEMEAMKENAI